ncbi:MAG: amidase [Proteobacteria bacterium]|nr:amidase [Pseudomonadota bacterium]
MTESWIVRLPARDIADRVRSKQLTATQVLEAHLAQIAAENPKVNAVCTVAEDKARGWAAEVDAKVAAGEDPGLLAGVPVGIKDVHPTAGIRTTWGSPTKADFVPEEDAATVLRVKAAGAVVIGKTNTPEYAAGANTFNDVFGATRNPWDLSKSASGSTGGGAAALASRMIALADGSDLGGSLRTPASFCGVVGLRPTPGLVPSYPTTRYFDMLPVAGPMARDVGDTALMLQALAGEDPRDPRTFPIVGRDFAGAPMKSVEGMRIAYISDFAKIGVEPEIDEICRAATYQIGTWGAKVEEIDLDLSFAREAFLQLRGQLMVTAHLDRIGLVDKFGPNLAGNIRRGLAQGPKDVAQGEVTRSKLVDEWTKVFAKYDAVCCPCSPVAPFPVEQNYPEIIAGKKMTTYIDWVAATFLVTMAGLPAISVPAGLDANRLPVGLQIVTRRHREEQMLALAAKVEKMRPIGFAPSHA